jgi:myo-inositol-1(or 4)-monophosphatase
MVGLLEDDIPVAGGIALPYFEKIYLAERGTGCVLNGKKLHLGDHRGLSDLLVSYGIDAHPEDPARTLEESRLVANLVLHIRNLRSSNSVFDVAMVLEGRYGAWLNQTSKIWDNVAQQVIIEEAGGVYTDFWGKTIDYSDALGRAADNFTVCTAPSRIHAQLQQLIQAATR